MTTTFRAGHYDDRCRDAATRQMPTIAKYLRLEALPVDPADEKQLHLHQTGGFCMVIQMGDRMLTEDAAEGGDVKDGVLYYVGTVGTEEEPEGISLYYGDDFNAAMKVLAP